ncbi:MAG: histidinol-phosphate transaminase [Proteocatella sp.]
MIKPRKTVQNLKPYFVDERPCRIKLDANEGSNYLLSEDIVLSQLGANLYPDSDATGLRAKLASYYGCKKENLIMGNGSSELIHLVISTYCEAGDKVLTFTPGFSMYDVYCQLCEAQIVKLEAGADFSQNIDILIAEAVKISPKVVILCNPNNPTGYVNSKQDVIKLLENIKDAVLVIDEAYADFEEESVISEIENYDNLVVLRTMSKAFGLANLRVGCAVARKEIIGDIWKVKVPYNLNGPSQILAELALENMDKISSYISEVKAERQKLFEAIKSMVGQEPDSKEEGVKVYPSGANFLFIKSPNLNLAEELFKKGIAIRDFGGPLRGFYRITVGTPQENREVIKALAEVFAVS